MNHYDALKDDERANYIALCCCDDLCINVYCKHRKGASQPPKEFRSVMSKWAHRLAIEFPALTLQDAADVLGRLVYELM